MSQLTNSEKKIAETFNARFNIYGPTPEASLWFSKKRQAARFSNISELIFLNASNKKFSIGDIGCGYGGFLEYLNRHHSSADWEYVGYDIADRVIDYCLNNSQTAEVKFIKGSRPYRNADFHVMSGTYNYAPETSVRIWSTYIRNELKHILDKTNQCMIFNLMIADKPTISNSDIFYEELGSFLSFCDKQLGQTTVFEHPLLKQEKTFCVTKS